MPNQTPHTPQNQTTSPADGKGIITMKAPVFPKEMLEKFEQTKAMKFSEKTIKEVNELLIQSELKKQQNQQSEYIEINGIKLETENLGRPTCSKIQIYQQQSSETMPQAWEKDGNWYYNFLGAQAEAEFLGKEIPTAEQWQKISAPYGQDGERLSKELNIPMLDYYNWHAGFSDIQKLRAYYWSSTLDLGSADGLVFTTTMSSVSSHSRSNGFSVRCIMKPEEKIQERDRLFKK